MGDRSRWILRHFFFVYDTASCYSYRKHHITQTMITFNERDKKYVIIIASTLTNKKRKKKNVAKSRSFLDESKLLFAGFNLITECDFLLFFYFWFICITAANKLLNSKILIINYLNPTVNGDERKRGYYNNVRHYPTG